jgi:hypothetical protein
MDSAASRRIVSHTEVTSGLPVIRPESMPSAEITSYKTYRY